MEPVLYCLPLKVTLEVTADEAWLLCDKPLVASRLNTPAGKLLERVLHTRQPVELCPEESAFLQEMVAQGWLEATPLPLTPPFPLVSVVIPVRNRPQEIKASLQALLELDYPHDRLEIIVVDDASEDETPSVVRCFPVHLLEASRWQGAAACRNLGARQASGSIIAFTDSDCQVSKTWLMELVPYLSLPHCVAVGGRVLPAFERSLMDRYAAVSSALDMGTRARPVQPGSTVFYVPSCNLLVKRDALMRIGGFDPGFPIGEDIDLEYRLMHHGGVVWYAPCGSVYHAHRTRLQSRWLRQLDYAASEGYLQKRHPELRKQLRLPTVSMLLIGIVLAAIVSRDLRLLLLLPFLIAFEMVLKWRRSRPLPIPVSSVHLLTLVLEGHWATLEFISWLILRYYLVFAILLALAVPSLLPLGLLLLSAPIGEFERSRPKVALPLFILMYLLDSVAYHVGILGAVVRQRTAWPIRTRVVVT